MFLSVDRQYVFFQKILRTLDYGYSIVYFTYVVDRLEGKMLQCANLMKTLLKQLQVSKE